jgi:succinoglycan biosynthesis protein ExoO
VVEVSVIVPAYNVGHSLLQALKSVCDQRLRDIEILVVDDASHDQSYEIARSVSSVDSRVRVIRRATNGGPSAARNSGLDAAQGTWIALLDADDLYLPERLAVLTDAARSAECDLMADNIMLRSAESGRCLGLAIPPSLAASHRHLTAAEFVHGDRPFPGGFQQFGYLMPLIRRAFLDEHKIRYDPDIWLAEDFVLYARCLLAGARMMLLPDAYYHYTLSENSISRADANLARNHEHLAVGNARVLALARNQGDRATITQLKTSGQKHRVPACLLRLQTSGATPPVARGAWPSDPNARRASRTRGAPQTVCFQKSFLAQRSAASDRMPRPDEERGLS